MAEVTMPCEWPVLPCGELPPAGPEYDNLHDACAEVLWALSGRQFGCCEHTVRPCMPGCPDPIGATRWPDPRLVAGEWVNMSCRTCYSGGRHCDCSWVCEVKLDGQACGLISVVIGGEAVPTGSFRIDDGEWLVRTDGECLPMCQDAEGWTVTYMRGISVPPGGQRSLGEIMAQVYAACNSKPCALPQHLQTIAKQGVTVGMFNPLDFVREGKTGLYFTDLWLTAVNPQARPQAARIASPDYDPGRVTTWP